MVQVNANQVIYFAKAMVSQLQQRFDTTKKKAAIVVVSSCAAINPISGLTTYCATKTFASYVAEGINVELRDKIDVLNYEPAYVSTKLLKGNDGKPDNMGTITPQKSADVCFRDLGSR